MANTAIVLHDVLPLSSAAVLLMPALIAVVSAIAVTLAVLFSRFVAASSTALWGWVQMVSCSLRRAIGVPCP